MKVGRRQRSGAETRAPDITSENTFATPAAGQRIVLLVKCLGDGRDAGIADPLPNLMVVDVGVTLVSVSDGIDSSTPAGRMMIGVLGSLAEYERELIKERSALKRQMSRSNGTKFGRPRKVGDQDHIATAKRMKADGHTAKAIGKYLGVSRATLYRYLAEDVTG